MNAQEILKQYYGYDAFRPGQEEIITQLASGRDAMCVMPTGAGKSLCFQIPALMGEGVSLVVSPLISLMQDQVFSLVKQGVPAAYINSSLTYGQYLKVLENIRAGRYKIIYVAPERLETESFVELAKELPIDLIAIDEAHCISQWGQDFRPSYLKILDFIEALPKRPTVGAFTATATPTVRDDIIQILHLENPLVKTTGFDRPNLYFGVEKPKNKLAALLRYIRSHEGESGIVYCSTRKQVEEVHQALVDQGLRAGRYHAGLSDEERRQTQEDFEYDNLSVIVATNAFGMGIDKSNVSYVLHYNMPSSLEAYYQEAGRAGRDGSPAECILYYSGRDFQTQMWLIEHSEPNPNLSADEQQAVQAEDLRRLRRMSWYCQTHECLREFILHYFGQKCGPFCDNCSSCRANFVRQDKTREGQILLSCIVRTGQRYGAALITDVVRGSKSKRVLSLGLDTQTTYGLLKDESAHEIRQLLSALEEEGFLISKEGKYPVLLVTRRGLQLLRGEVKAEVRVVEETKTYAQELPAMPAASLMSALKKKRLEFSREERIPAYMIFSDATLREMAGRRPASLEDFQQIQGIAKVKTEKYGEAFLEVIREYEADHPEENVGLD